MKKPQILKRGYNGVSQVQLPQTARQIYNLMKDKPDYADYASDMEPLDKAINQLNDLLAIKTSGTDEYLGTLRRQAVQAVKDRLNAIADRMNIRAGLTEAYILGAGFSLAKTAQRHTEEPNPPVILSAKATQVPHQLEVRIQLGSIAPGTKKIEYEHSSDGGKTWVAGQFSDGSRVLLTGLPSGELMLRARTLATRGRKSDWSQPFVARVL